MEINTLFKCEELNVLVMVALLSFMDVRRTIWSRLNSMTVFWKSSFGKTRIARYFLFCSSMIRYCDYTRSVAKDEAPDLRLYEGVIDDPKYIGVNVVWLFEIPSFFELFFSTLPAEDYRQFYFPVQFEEYMFNGKNLYYFFIGTKDNPNWLLLNKHAAEIINGNEQLDDDTTEGDRGEEAGTE